MRTTRWMLLGAMMAAAGCGGVVVRVPSEGDAAPTDVTSQPDAVVRDTTPSDVPRTCRSTADCNPGEECGIREGCDVPSYCGPALGRPCTGDLAPFCGCDGSTFFGSSSCPQRVYAHRGACATVVDAGPPPACVLSNGTLCPVGATCPDPDGCNTCTCSPGGALACTERACVDAGPPVCMLPYGGTCPVGVTCPVDRCTVCTCLAGGGIMCASRCTDAGTPDAGTVSCAPQDARGEGLCDGFFGYAWNGSTCTAVTGCRCVGADCPSLSRDPDACRARYAPCG